ncbi:hypothetical protein RMATCC62417_11341 [Rhizopus microsporus]|nr:hypothetical protein RMATCC62417_11341 [Rhizopus microsporus]
MTRILDNIFLLSTIILAYVAWLIAFIGACVFRVGVSGGAWWIIVYELLIIIGVTCILVTNTFTHYRMMILAFLGASISLLTIQLDYITPASRVFGGGAGAFATGYIVLIIIQFLWVMIFGSDPESYIGQYGPSHYGNSVGIQHHRQQQPQQQQAYEMTGEKTILSDPPVQTAATPTTVPATTPTTTTQEPNTALSASNQVTEMSQPSPVEYREKVKALHACKLILLSMIN